MNPLPAPLLLLLWLRLRAAVRLLLRSLRTTKGKLVAVAILFGFSMMFVPALIDLARPRTPEADAILAASRARTAALLPFGLLALVLVTMLRTSADGALAFLQAEVDFLFPGPFTRRQLLAYKLAQRVVPLLVGAAFFAIWLRQVASGWLGAWIGVTLALWFVHLASLALALLGHAIGKRRIARGAATAALLVAALAVGGVLWTRTAVDSSHPLEWLRTFGTTPLGWTITLPTRPFAAVMTEAIGSSAWLTAFAVAIGINVGLLLAVVRLDALAADWLEAGEASSRRLAAQIEEMQRTGGFSAGKPLSGIRLPMLPRVGGIGPLVWRQLLTGARQGLRGLLVIGVVLLMFLLPSLFTGGGSGEGSGAAAQRGWGGAVRPLIPIAVVYMSLFLPQVLRLDFRADADRLDLLKSLPVAPTAVVLAQVLAPALLITALQMVVGAIAAPMLSLAVGSVLVWAPALLMANLLNVALDNAAFLLWPIRPNRGAGVQFAPTQVVAQFGKMIGLLLGLGVAGGAGAVAYLALGRSLEATAVAVACVLAVEAAVVIALLRTLFVRFDPAAEQPAEG